MGVYVDDAAIMYRSKPRFHLAADSLAELHAFCREVGINKCWFHPAKGHPHYDITAEQREASIKHGAIAMSSEDLLCRTETGRRSLRRRLEQYADDPEQLAYWTAKIPPGADIAQNRQKELF